MVRFLTVVVFAVKQAPGAGASIGIIAFRETLFFNATLDKRYGCNCPVL